MASQLPFDKGAIVLSCAMPSPEALIKLIGLFDFTIWDGNNNNPQSAATMNNKNNKARIFIAEIWWCKILNLAV